MKKENQLHIATFVTIAFIIGITFFVTETIVDIERQKVVETKNSKIALLAANFQDQIINAISILDASSNLPAVQKPKDVTLVSEAFKGIPGDKDTELRNIAKDILSRYEFFENVAFLLPNGDVYIVEPYATQEKLKTLNFAFRDYFIGATSTKSIYVSEVFLSQTTDHNTVEISVPILDQEGTLEGLWQGSIDIDVVGKKIKNFVSDDKEQVLVVDHRGMAVLDSSRPVPIEHFRSFSHSEAVNRALAGEFGTKTEDFGGIKMFVNYSPLQVGTHTWGIVLIQPYDQFVSFEGTIRGLSYLVIAALSASVAVSALQIYKRTSQKQRRHGQKHETLQPEEQQSKPRYEALNDIEMPNQKRIKAKTSHKAHYFLIIGIFAGLTGAFIFTSVAGDFANMQQETSSLSTKYLVQNLKGDTVDTWYAWQLVGEDETITVSIIGKELISEQEIEAIEDVIFSEEFMDIDNSLLHKGPKGTTSRHYVGWSGAMKVASGQDTEFYIPTKFNMVESLKGTADITIVPSEYKDGDGYTGFTKSVVDQNQILKSTITIYDIHNLTTEQLKTIVRHEFGHALGLAHSTAPEDLMAPTISTEFPYISPCNIDAIVALYDGKAQSKVVCEI